MTELYYFMTNMEKDETNLLLSLQIPRYTKGKQFYCTFVVRQCFRHNLKYIIKILCLLFIYRVIQGIAVEENNVQ